MDIDRCSQPVLGVSSPAEESVCTRSPDPVHNEMPPPPIPVRSPRRRPTGAVATVMVSERDLRGKHSVDPDRQRKKGEREVREDSEEQSLARNPYDLMAAVGSTVTASYPFHGDEGQQQLSFGVSVYVLRLGSSFVGSG